MASVLNGADDARAALARAFSDCARRLHAVSFASLPAQVRARAAAILADDLGAAFSAVREPEVARARALALAHAPAGPVSLLAPGRPRLSLHAAARLNGLAMGWNELDEGYRRAVCHGGLYVLPALLAQAEADGASAAEVLRALVLGYELAARTAAAFRFPVMRIHPHALLAPVGAAAGVAFLRRVPAEQLIAAVAGATALGMAGPFNQAVRGALVRNAWAAHGAVAGLAAVDDAACGIGGQPGTPHDVYVTALDAQCHPDAYADDGQWAVLSGYQKINACCQYAHSAIEAVQALLRRHPGWLGGEAVRSVRVQAHPLALGLDNREPATTLAGKFSLPHAVATALVHGHGGAEAFAAGSLAEPRVARLRQALVVEPFPEPRAAPHDRPARVFIAADDGQDEETCLSAQGGPDKPFDAVQIEDKLRALCRPVAPAAPGCLRRLAECARRDDPGSAAALARPWAAWLDEMYQGAPDA
ncbi:MmgE/PrpD family protein [Bordetella genomosp. 13]|uniref:MmgE/PrpD family protein n=1 Tax=Bordetella genomosp. 13 TaxID=463040 RepID=UPI0011A9A87E|nr:MmgE/PrpD family protein [Bordetella genomosp. 13]